MGARDIPFVLIALHFDQQVEQFRLQLLSVIDGKIAVVVMDDAIRWTSAVGLVHQQAVGGQLKNMRVIRRFRRPAGLHLDRDDLSILLDEVIGLTGQPKTLME